MTSRERGMRPLKVLATSVGAALLVWGLLLAYASSPAWAADITVDTTADEQNADGDCSLREAITAANTDAAVDECAPGTGEDTIFFDLGTSATITLDPTLGQLPAVTDADGLTIDGGDAEIAVSGGDEVRVFSVAGGARLDLENLTVSNGRTADFGGGVINQGGTLNVTDSTFSGNDASFDGGGIYNNGGGLTVTGSTFSGNGAAAGGGGIFNANNPGGATVINSTFSGNSTSNNGGAISNQLGGSQLQVIGSTFSGNSSFFGGAIFAGPNTGATLRNSVVGNNPSSVGGSCFTDTALGGRLNDGGYNIDAGTSCGFSTANNSQPSTDPLLDPAGLRDNGGPTQTIALQEGSPAIDKGNSFGATTDQRGESRPHDFADIDNAPGGDGSDIGAFEAQPPPNEAPAVAVARGGACGASDTRGTINLSLSDPDDPPEDLELTATSSDQGVLPDGNIVLGGGTDASRTLTVTAIGSSGTSTVTVTVSDPDDLEGSVPVRVVVGTNARDALTGTARSEMIFARKGNDAASGRGANDLLCGGNGNDSLGGGGADDTLRGGNNDDRMSGGAGADLFGGGSGTDTATDFDSGEGDTQNGVP